MIKIAVIGTGYVGLVTGTGLSDFGNKVVCTDINKEKIEILQKGEIPIYEPGLKELIDRNVSSGRLSFSHDIGTAIQNAEVIFIAVWTPMGVNGEADLSAVIEVAKTIGRNLNRYKVICTKSTVPIGTGDKIKEVIKDNLNSDNSDNTFDVVSNPEFMREGSAVKDFLLPNRVVIGTESEKAKSIMKNIYRPLFINETPMVFTNIPTAETIKYASNAFLAVKISFINEIANLCDVTGADVHVVAKGMGLDGRISPKFLHPGPGFGGSCFPKDTSALIHMGEKRGVDFNVVMAALKTNEHQRLHVYKKLLMLMNENVKGKKVAILGLAFKANTDDVRKSAAVYFLEKLLKDGAIVTAFDPIANSNMEKIFPAVGYCNSLNEAVKDTDAVVILTEWHEFRGMDLEKVASLVREKVILDVKNILNPNELKRLGYNFDNVGRPTVK